MKIIAIGVVLFLLANAAIMSLMVMAKRADEQLERHARERAKVRGDRPHQGWGI